MALDTDNAAREALLAELRAHALVIGEVVLTSGRKAQYLVEDVVTTGGSTIEALEALRNEGLSVCGVLAICDRLAGGGRSIEDAAEAPFVALTTIDEVYPERPDR